MSAADRSPSPSTSDILRPPTPGVDLALLTGDFFDWMREFDRFEVNKDLEAAEERITFLEPKVAALEEMLAEAKERRAVLLKQQGIAGGLPPSAGARRINLVTDDESDTAPTSKVQRGNVSVSGPSTSKATGSRKRQREPEVIEVSDSEEDISPRRRTSARKGKGRAMVATTSKQRPLAAAEIISDSN